MSNLQKMFLNPTQNHTKQTLPCLCCLDKGPQWNEFLKTFLNSAIFHTNESWLKQAQIVWNLIFADDDFFIWMETIAQTELRLNASEKLQILHKWEFLVFLLIFLRKLNRTNLSFFLGAFNIGTKAFFHGNLVWYFKNAYLFLSPL